MSRTLQQITLAVFLLSAAAPGFGWGAMGHRISGAIAEDYLTPQARQAVQDVLGSESLLEASTWADEMRSSPEPFWQEQAGPWHYVTVPEGKRYQDVGAPAKGDAVAALARFRRMLLDPATTQSARQLALRFSVHIIADLHQPLHVGNGRDRGGNKVRVKLLGEGSNLHSVWDSGLIRTQDMSLQQWLTSLRQGLTPARAQAWDDSDPLVWVGESAALRPSVYPRGANLEQDYIAAQLPLLRQRLAQSGVRIGAYLNDLYKK